MNGGNSTRQELNRVNFADLRYFTGQAGVRKIQGGKKRVETEKQGQDKKNGFILIAVLWISLLLSIFALNSASKSRLVGIQAMNIQESLVVSQALHSALSKGYHEYLRFEENKSLLSEKNDWEKITGKRLDLWHPRYEPYELDIQGKSIGVRIVNANGKININKVDVGMLEKIVSLCGTDDGAAAASVANSILDWIDKDDFKRPGGAEKDYYLSLADPYLPKNNDIQDIRELLLVKGVDRDLFYGTSHQPGLVHFFSVRGGSEKFDINSAASETFVLAGDISPHVISYIQKKRMEKPFFEISELGEVFPQEYFSNLQKYFEVKTPDMIEIQAFLILNDGRKGRSLTRVHRTQ